MSNHSLPDGSRQAADTEAVRHAHLSFRNPTPRDRAILMWGVVRRFLLGILRPGYRRAAIARREGDCHRCGACCQMTARCPHLRYEDGLSACAAYGRRPTNCQVFPMDARDLADRDRIAPGIPCGYTFRPVVAVPAPRRDTAGEDSVPVFREVDGFQAERSA